jgi:hypothetical protein
MKFYIYFHNADADGTLSGFMLKYAIENNILHSDIENKEVRMMPINYGYDVNLDYLHSDPYVYMVDFSLDEEYMLKIHKKIGDKFIWIDHHDSIEEYNSTANTLVNGVRQYDLAACMLTFLYIKDNGEDFTKEFNRLKSFVYYVGEYDIYNNKAHTEDEWTDIVSFNLYVKSLPQELSSNNIWSELIENLQSEKASEVLEYMVGEGYPILGYINKDNYQLCKSYGSEINIGEHKAFIVNKGIGGTYVFSHFNNKYPIQICAVYSMKSNFWSLSCYADEGINLLDLLSEYNPKGHKGACNIKAKSLEIVNKQLHLCL